MGSRADQVGTGGKAASHKLKVTEHGDQPVGGRMGLRVGGSARQSACFLKTQNGGGLLLPMQQRNEGLYPFCNRL